MSLAESVPREDSRQGLRVRQAELIISGVLRAGVLTSLVTIVAGTLLTFFHHPDYLSSPAELERLSRPGAAVPQTLHQVVTGIAALHGRSIVGGGLLLLIATPVMRVAVSILAFVAQRDWIYVLITSAVLLLILLSFAIGHAA
jgi:uncharacterized membrane protein